MIVLYVWLFYGFGDHRDLHVLTHSFPTRRSADRSGVLGAAGALLGAGGDAGAALGDAVDFAVAAQCAEALGITSVLNAATVEYAKVRQQFGQPIGRFQALQHRLVDMYVAESEARGMAATLPALFGMANRRSAAVSAAKVQIAEAGRLIAEEAIQIHGGLGMKIGRASCRERVCQYV